MSVCVTPKSGLNEINSVNRNENFVPRPMQTVDCPDETRPPFYDSTLHNLLLERGVLKKNNLSTSVTLPPCSPTQTNALVDLIDEPFDWVDNNDSSIVLEKISVREILILAFNTPAFKSPQMFERMQMAGGGVTRVIESDMDWVAQLIKGLLGDDYSKAARHIQAFPRRNLPDIDIHLICASQSDAARRLVLQQLLESLGRLVWEKNRQYIESQMEKIAKMDLAALAKNKELAPLQANIKAFQLNKDTPNPQLLNDICSGIIRANCLKKLSHNPFGSLLAFGQLELVLTEKPGHLLTPDHLAIIFDIAVQKNSNGLRLFPENEKSAEAVIHRAAKIACIDHPTEHTFIKACFYLVLGYHVPEDANFKDALSKFLRHIYSHSTESLTAEGVIFLKRFENNHFKDNPEEGLCILFTLYRFILNERPEAIPHITRQLRVFLGTKVDDPILEAMRKALVEYPNDFRHISQCLALIPHACTVKGSQALWHTFGSREREAWYCLRLGSDRLSIVKELNQVKDTAILEGVLNLLLDGDPSIFDSSEIDFVNLLLENLQNPDTCSIAFSLLLRCHDKAILDKFLAYLPDLYFAVPADKRPSLLKSIQDKFDDPQLTDALRIFAETVNDKENAKKVWLIILASTSGFSKTAYQLWDASSLKDDTPFSIELALKLIRHSIQFALRITEKIVKDNKAEKTETLEDEAFAALSKLMSARSNVIERELSNVIQPVVVWLIRCLVNRNEDDRAKALVAHTCQFLPLMDILSQTDIRYWHLLERNVCIDHLNDIAKKGRLHKFSEGMDYLSKNQPTPTQILALLETFQVVSTHFQGLSDIEVNSQLKSYVALLSIPIDNSDPNRLRKVQILFKIFRKCNALHLASKLIVHFNSLRALCELVFSHSYETCVQSGVKPAEISEELILLLKDTTRPLEPLRAKIAQFLPGLIQAIINQQDLLVRLFRALDTSRLSIPETKEIAAIRFKVDISSSDTNVTMEARIQRLFDASRNLTPDQFTAELGGILGQMLYNNYFSRLKAFLTGLKAFKPDFDFRKINLKILEKLNALLEKNDLKKTIELLDISLEMNLHALDDSEYHAFFLKLIQSLKPIQVKENWDFLFNLMLSDPALRPVLLRLLMQNVPQKQIESLENYWIKEIEENQYTGLTPDEIRVYIVEFLAALARSKSRQIFYLLKFAKLIEARLLSEQIFPVCSQWILDCCATIKDPANLDRDEFNTFCEYWESFESRYLDSMRQEYDKRLTWAYIKFMGASRSGHCVMCAWHDIHSVILEGYFETAVVNSHVELVLDNSKPLKDHELSLDEESQIFDVSNTYRKAHVKDVDFQNPDQQLRRQVSPFRWVQALVNLNSESSFVEALKWAEVYLSVSNVENGPSKQALATIQQVLEGVLVDPYHNTAEVLTSVCNCLRIIGKRGEFTLVWNSFSRIVIQLWEKTPYKFHTKILIAFYKIALKSAPGVLRISYGADTLIKHIFDLYMRGKIEETTYIWNHLVTSVPHKLKEMETPYFNTYTKSRESASVNCVTFPNLKLFEDPQQLPDDALIFYSDRLIIAIQRIASLVDDKSLSQVQRVFFYDWAYGCLKQILIMNGHSKGLNNPVTIKAIFGLFLDLVKTKDHVLLKQHYLFRVSGLLELLINCQINFEKDDLFYEAFIKAGCPLHSKILLAAQVNKDLSNASDVIVNAERVSTAIDTLRSVESNPNATPLANGYFLSVLDQAIETRTLVDLGQYARYVQRAAEFWGTPDVLNADAETQDQLFETRFFRITDWRSKYIVDLAGKEQNSAEALKEFYLSHFSSFIHLLTTPYLPLRMQESLTNDCLGWFSSYRKYGFSDFSPLYRANLLLLLNVVSQIITSKRDTEEYKFAILPLVLFTTPLSDEGFRRRGELLVCWFEYLTMMNTPLANKIYNVSLDAVIRAGMFKGLDDLLTQAKSLMLP